MSLANTAWNEANVERVHDLLTAHIPKQNETDLRGFEWNYLWNISHTELATTSNPDFQISQGSIAFSPDGKQIKTITKDGKFQLWDAATLQEKNTVIGAEFEAVMVPALSMDQQLIASIIHERKNEIGIWETASGKLRNRFPLGDLQTTLARSFAFSPDNKSLAVGFYTGQLLLLDLETGKPQATVQGQRGQINSVTYSPDGSLLASCGYGGSIKLWDAKTAKELAVLDKPGGIWRTVAFSPDGHFLVASGSQGAFMIWDAKTIQELKTLRIDGDTKVVAFSSDGKKMVTAGDDLRIRIWDTQNWTVQASFTGHGNPIRAVAFAPQEDKIISGSEDGIIKVWDLRKKQTPLEFCGVKQGGNELTFSRDSRRIILGSPSQSLMVRDIAAGNEIYSRQAHRFEAQHTGHPFHTLLTADGQTLITGGDDGLAFWDFNSGQERRRISLDQINSIALSADNRLLATSLRGNGLLQIWDMQTGIEQFKLKPGRSNSMVFLPDNQTIATGFDQLLFIDALTGQTTVRHDFKKQVIFYLKLSPDQRTLASGTNLGLVSLHDATTGRELLTLKGHSGSIAGMAFSPDGKRLVTSANDGIRIWDVNTGQEVFSIRQNNIGRLAFSPDGKYLAAVSNGRFKLFSTVTMDEFTSGCK